MSFLSWFRAEKAFVEADVQKVITAIANAEKVALADLQKSLVFLANEGPAAVQALAAATTFATAITPVAPQAAVVAASLGVAQGIVANLTAFSQKYAAATSGGITASQAVQAIGDGYQVVNQARAAIANLNHATTAAALPPASTAVGQ